MRITIVLMLLLIQSVPAQTGVELEQAARTYDRAAAEALLPATAQDNELAARTRLLCAELCRIEFEQLPESAVKERREIGKAIDVHAEAGILLLESLPDTSEKFRTRADLLGTMIRSNYRAGKMKGEMKAAVDEALRLDPANARAIVSQAKMLIFNPSASDRELQEGEALVLRALAMDPALEQARLLQAHALERLGEREKAVAIWEACLQANPACTPARKALATPDPPGASERRNVK
jgi:hypothetical protein